VAMKVSLRNMVPPGVDAITRDVYRSAALADESDQIVLRQG
jgi:hypothetical protein